MYEMRPSASRRVMTSDEFWTSDRKRASLDFRLSVDLRRSSARLTRSSASATLEPGRATPHGTPRRQRLLGRDRKEAAQLALDRQRHGRRPATEWGGLARLLDAAEEER